MLKYTDTMVTFREVPDEISLCINISNCPIHCPDCHSKELWEDIGKELTTDELDKIINKNIDCTVVVIMGGDAEPKEVNAIAQYIIRHYNLEVCWYSGKEQIPSDIDLSNFDYIKVGPYIKEKGGLDNPNTNQKFYKTYSTRTITESGYLVMGLEDITYKFWK